MYFIWANHYTKYTLRQVCGEKALSYILGGQGNVVQPIWGGMKEAILELSSKNLSAHIISSSYIGSRMYLIFIFTYVHREICSKNIHCCTVREQKQFKGHQHGWLNLVHLYGENFSLSSHIWMSEVPYFVLSLWNTMPSIDYRKYKDIHSLI